MTLIALEGIDGAGKTTILPKIAERLRDVYPNSQVIKAGEFGSPLGPVLRQSLSNLNMIEKVLWFAADRASVWASLDTIVNDESIILWDRYVASAITYRTAEARRSQGDAQRIMEYVTSVNNIFPRPDLYLYLDVPVLEARRRKRGSGGDLLFIQECYGEILPLLDSPMRTVDATLPVAEVVRVCVSEIIQSGVVQQ
jgi:dTMP kinase